MISADVTLDNWHHVAGTWDGSTMKLYVDGDFVGEEPFPWTLSTPSNPNGNTIGANCDPDPNNPAHVCSFNGKIDEVRVYSRALTESEIKTLYDGQEGGCGRITNWKTLCQGVYSPGQKVGAEMEFENLMAGGYNFKGVVTIRSPTGDEYTNSEVEWVPSAPNPQGKFAAGDALYVTIPEGASAGNYDMKLELWNDDTDELCDKTEWKEDLFIVGQEDTDAVLVMHFNEGSGTAAKDSSGYGNDGTIYGAKWVDGRCGKALSFDGVEDYVDCGTDPILQIKEAIAVSAWVKRHGGTGIECGILEAYGLGKSPYGYRLSYWPEVARVRWCLRAGVYGTHVASDGDLPLNEWTHVVGVRDSDGNMYMYINGVKQTDTKVYTNTLNPKLPLYIGRHANYYFDGVIDELRIYNRALTESEIKALYEQGGDTTSSNLLENPGFESGELDPWYSTEYYDPYKKCDWISIGVDSKARYEGEYGAYIDILCSLDAWGRIIQEPVEITPGEKLAVEAKLMYKGDLSDGYAELWLVFLDADKKALDHVYKKYYESDFGAEDKWLSAVLPATTAPSNAKYVRVMVGLADVKSCRLNIDDVMLKSGSAIGNHPPTAIRVEPVPKEVYIDVGDTITFRVKAEDEDEDVHNNLKMIKWFIDGNLGETNPADGTSEEASFTYTFENRGMFSAKATVYDERMEEDSVTWEVNVGVTGEFAIKVVDVTGKIVEGASVLLCKYKTAEYPGTEIKITDSGEADSEGFYFPPHDKIKTCDLLVVKKNNWFYSEDLQNVGEIPKVIKLPLVYEMLDEDLITVDGLDYKLYVWRSVDSLNPKRNRLFAEIHRRGGADLESGFFGFTKDESVDVEHDTKLIWFSYWSLDDRFDGTPDTELPVRATYDPVVLQIPSSTTINEKKILQEGADKLIGVIPFVGNAYTFYKLMSDIFWWEEEMVYYGQYDSEIDMDENKYDTTFEAWKASESLGDHLQTVVYEETMEFPEVGEYRVVPFIQFKPEILPPKTCIWAKEIKISVFEK